MINSEKLRFYRSITQTYCFDYQIVTSQGDLLTLTASNGRNMPLFLA